MGLIAKRRQGLRAGMGRARRANRRKRPVGKRGRRVRGFILGGVSGLALVAVVLGAASLLAPQPAGNAPPERPQTELPDDVPEQLPEAPGPATGPATGAAVAPEPALGPAPLPGAVVPEGGLPDEATAPAAVPAAEAVVGALSDVPAAAAGPAAVETAGDSPVAVPAPVPAPLTPVAEVPAAAPPAAAEPPATAPAAPVMAAPGPVGLDPAAPAPAAAEGAAAREPAAPPATPPDAPAVAGSDPPEPVAVAPADPDPAPVPAATAEPTAPAEGTLALPAPQPAAPPAPETPDAPGREVAAALPEGVDSVRINRPATEAPAPAPDPATEVMIAEGPALSVHAAPFEAAEGLPLMAVVMIDDGQLPGGPALVGALPFAVTVALDPAAEGAGAAMTAYRAAGIEVAALLRLPPGATVQDAEVTYEASFATLPAAVAAVLPSDAGIEGSDLRAALLRRLAEDGRGIVAVVGGLDGIMRDAAQDSVPGAAVLRDLDAEGQEAAVIRRFVDQAAFRARQEGEVVLLSRLRAETLTALTLWGTGNRAGTVALAPLSAVLNAP